MPSFSASTTVVNKATKMPPKSVVLYWERYEQIEPFLFKFHNLYSHHKGSLFSFFFFGKVLTFIVRDS